MATKTELKKWIKEIVNPTIKPYGYKFGPVKEFGNALAVYNKTNDYLSNIIIQISRDHTVAISIIRFDDYLLTNKINTIIQDEIVIKQNTLFQLPETHPYYEYAKKLDTSFLKPIHTKEQLEKHFQPFIDKFNSNLKLLAYYRYIPNLLKKWDEVQSIYEKTGDYEQRNKYFPSPYKFFHIYYFYRLLNYPESNVFYEKQIISFQDSIQYYKEKKHYLEKTYIVMLNNFKKLKTYFDNLSDKDIQKLKQVFAPFFVPPQETTTSTKADNTDN